MPLYFDNSSRVKVFSAPELLDSFLFVVELLVEFSVLFLSFVVLLVPVLLQPTKIPTINKATNSFWKMFFHFNYSFKFYILEQIIP